MGAGKIGSVKRYQLRLLPGEKLGGVRKRLCRAAVAFLESLPNWGRHAAEDLRALESEVHECLEFYVTGYDLCGLKVSCFESALILGGGPPPEPRVADPRDWEGVRVLQIEVHESLDEFWSALESAVFRALCGDPRRAHEAKSARPALGRALRSALGPRLFRSMEYECDVCNVVKRIDPWTLEVSGAAPSC